MGAKIGTRVLYTLNSGDAAEINAKRDDHDAHRRHTASESTAARTGHQGHVGNRVAEGEQYPAVIARVFHPETTTANLQVTLDGTDAHWATSRQLGDGPGTYQHMEH